MRDPEPLPFETRGSHSSGVGGSRTAPPDIDRIARETPSRVLGVRDPGLQADVCNEKRHPPDIGETRAYRE